MLYFYLCGAISLVALEICAVKHIRWQREGYYPQGLPEARVDLEKDFEKHHDQKQRATISTTGPRNSKLLFGVPRAGAATTLPPSSSIQERRLPTSTKRPTFFESSVTDSGDSEDLIKKSAKRQAWRVKSHGEDLEKKNNLSVEQPTKRKLRNRRLRNVAARFAPRAGGVAWAALLPTPTRIIRYGR